MDVGTTNGWRLDEVVPATEVIETIVADAGRSSRPSAGYRGEVAERWRYLDGRGEIGVIASVTRPFCGDCTRARISAEGKLYTCLFSAVGHDLRDPLRAGASDEELADADRGDLGAAATTATRSAAPRPPSGCPRSRCSPSAVKRAGVGGKVRSGAVVHELSTSVRNSWTAGRCSAPNLVDNNVDPTGGRIRNVRLARRGRQGARNRDHIKDLEPGPVASGASVPGRDGVPAPSPGGPAGRDRHPGVGTLVGPAEVRGPPAVDPWTKLWRPAFPRDRSPPIPAERDRPGHPHPPRRPARAPRRARGRRPRPFRPRARGRDRARLRPRWSRRRPRGRRRRPVRELPGWPAATAPGPRRPAAPRARSAAGRSPCSRAASTCTRATRRGWSSSPCCCSGGSGAKVVVLTNAAGGLDPSFGPGTLMVISDHLNLTGQNPLIGPNAPSIGERFTDMTDAWSPALRARLHRRGRRRGRASSPRACTSGSPGRTTRRPPRSGCTRRCGGHAVGMSTVMECIAARWAGLEVCGVSLVTNAGAGLHAASRSPTRRSSRPAPRPARASRASSGGSSPTSTADASSRGRHERRQPGTPRCMRRPLRVRTAAAAALALGAGCCGAARRAPRPRPALPSPTAAPTRRNPRAERATTPPPERHARPAPSGVLALPTTFAAALEPGTYLSSPPFDIAFSFDDRRGGLGAPAT